MAQIRTITLRRLNLPLIRPYRLSYRTFDTFEPFMVQVETAEGESGFADAHISPGSSSETREGGWDWLTRWAQAAVGRAPADAQAMVLADFAASKVAATAFNVALEVLENNPVIDIPQDTVLPLLTPVNALEEAAIAAEIEDGIGRGFRTFKVKVGKDVEADLARVAAIQRAVGGRATLRLDANRAFDRADAADFAKRLDPEGIELFEQPCDADDWEANAAVAAASPVPLMLDEPICTLDDIRRASDIAGVGFCKLKLKRFGGLERLREGLELVRAHGMEPVLGDGLGSDIHSWLEACVARTTIRNAGEFNGFLKPHDRVLDDPLRFDAGAIHLPAGYAPRPDPEALARLTTEMITFPATRRTKDAA